MDMDYEWDPRYFDCLKTKGYAYIDDIVLNYSNYRQDNQFITIHPPCLLNEGKSGWPDEEKNLLASAWLDDTGALMINFSSKTTQLQNRK